MSDVVNRGERIREQGLGRENQGVKKDLERKRGKEETGGRMMKEGRRMRKVEEGGEIEKEEKRWGRNGERKCKV